MNRALLLVGAAALLSGCVTAPKPLEGNFVSGSPQAAAPEGERVRWGGSILSVEPKTDATCIQVLAQDLDSRARPLRGDFSAGRFVACRQGFYDPAVFAEGREITVVGNVSGTETRRVGEYDYVLPRLDAEVVYLWPERLLVDSYHYPYAGWWPYWYYGPPYVYYGHWW